MCAPMIVLAPDFALYECLRVSLLAINDDSDCWHRLMEWLPLNGIPPLQSPLCSPRATPAMTDQEPSGWPWKDLLVITGTPSMDIVSASGAWPPPATSSPIRLPGCTPTADPLKAGHLGRGGECNLQAVAAAGALRTDARPFRILLTGQRDGAILTRMSVFWDLTNKGLTIRLPSGGLTLSLFSFANMLVVHDSCISPGLHGDGWFFHFYRQLWTSFISLCMTMHALPISKWIIASCFSVLYTARVAYYNYIHR